MITINNIQEAFALFHQNISKREFAQNMQFEWWGERNLLPCVRFFLLGYFGAVLPEVGTQLISCNTGIGRLDFCIDNIAIELAVRIPNESKSKLTSYANRTEREKLCRRSQINTHLNYGVLILLDFSNNPLTNEQLEEYREPPHLGQGNFNRDDFRVAYFYYDDTGETSIIRKDIRF